MNLHYQRYFLQSGIITFLLITLIFSFMISGIVHSSKADAFAIIKSDVISISLDDAPAVESQTVSASLPIVEQSAVEPEKAPVAPAPVREIVPAVDDLFATVKTTKSKLIPIDNTKQDSELDALAEKVLTTKRDSKLFDKVKTFELSKPGMKMVSVSSGPAINEYNAKVQSIIYNNYHPSNGVKGMARIRITLSPDGHLLSYRVLSYSSNSIFNAEVDWLKERLNQITLPAHPQGVESSFEIILTAKE
jgi:hypothetical protein